MTLRFDGRVAVVTGAGRGIGRAHARLLAERGANVVVNDLGGTVEGTGADPAVARQAADDITAAGGTAIADAHDVSDPDGAAALVAAAIDAFGRLDVVVNNAGILVPVAGFADTPLEIFRRTMAVHYYGALHTSWAAWPHLVAAGQGRIVNTTSSGVFGSPGFVAYGAAKAAVLGLTRSLALEGVDVGVRVNAIAPGAFTRMTGVAESEDGERAPSDRPDLDAFSAFMERCLPAEKVSPAMAVLAHESCPFNGEVLSSSGGFLGRWVIGEVYGRVTPADPESFAAALPDLAAAGDPVVYPDMATQLARIQSLLEP